jgi:cytidylate kinase
LYIKQLNYPLISKHLKKLVIAIDGPAASGKSTTARLVAKKLGYLYVDTGAMYRAMTLKVLRQKIDLADRSAIARVADATHIRLEQINNETRVLLDREDVTVAIRLPEVTRNVSAVSMIQEVRTMLVREQRKLGAQGGIVVEGRDIGTVVFPDADLKVFMVADIDVRARRRQQELEARSIEVSLADLEQEIIERDRKDSQRSISPLRKHEEAVTVDTSRLMIDEQVEMIVAKANELIRRDPR